MDPGTKGMEFRVFVSSSFPYLSACVAQVIGSSFRLEDIHAWPKGCTDPGISLEFMRELCLYLQWRCPVTVLPGEEWGGNSTGKWDGIVRRIMDGEADTGGPAFEPTPGRREVVSFSRPVYHTNTYLLTRVPSPAKVSLGAVLAFRKEVWLLILLATLVMGAIALASERIRTPYDPHAAPEPSLWFVKQWLNKAIDFFAIFLNQSFAETNSLATNITRATWAMSCIVLVGTYGAFIMAQALGTFIPFPFNDAVSFAECMREGECELYTPTLSISYATRLLNTPPSDPGPYAIRQALKVQPFKVEADSVTMGKIRDGDGSPYPTILGSQSKLGVLALKLPPCAVHAVPIYQDSYNMVLPYRWAHLEVVNQAILWLQQAGVTAKIHHKYVLHALKRQSQCEPEVGAKPVSLWSWTPSLDWEPRMVG